MSSDFTTISHALSDPHRVRLLAACMDQERCVCQLVELIDLSSASISKHLAVLRNAGLLVSRKDGRWVHYRTPLRADDNPAVLVRDALAMFRKHAMRTPQVLADQQTLKQIDAIDPSELARQQREGCCAIPAQSSGITPTLNGEER
jgi:ArsR family transcriptional regulator